MSRKPYTRSILEVFEIDGVPSDEMGFFGTPDGEGLGIVPYTILFRIYKSKADGLVVEDDPRSLGRSLQTLRRLELVRSEGEKYFPNEDAMDSFMLTGFYPLEY